MKELLFFLTATFIISSTSAAIKPLTLSGNLDIEAPRWMFDPNQKVKGKGVVRSLYQIKYLQLQGKSKACFDKVNKTLASARSLQPWLARTRIDCAREFLQKNKGLYGPLARALDFVSRNQNWLSVGPHIKKLRASYIEGHLSLSQVYIRIHRKKAWKTLNHLFELKHWMTREQLGTVYQRAGELAFVQQDLQVAHGFFRRSLQYQESGALRSKLEAVKRSLIGEKKEEKKTSKEEKSVFLGDPNEAKLHNRMKNSLKSGDLVAAVEDGVELITGYWGGTKADWASEQVLRVFSGLVRKKEKKYNLLRDRVLAQMLKCDGFRLKDWAKRIYYRGYYEQAVHLAAKAREKLKGLPDSTEATLFLGRAAVGAGDYDVAQKAFRELYTRHGGTREAEQAMFRQGLVLLRREKYGAAVAVFERLLAANNDSNFDLQARYWMWRGLQLNKSEKATAAARDLIKRYPLTYYGLRARAETNSGKLAWFDNGKEQIEVELVLSDVERLSWEKFEILLRAGWFEEAQDELKFLPAPMSPEEKLIYSRLNSLAFDYYNGTKLIHEAWDEDESLMTKSYLHLAYPREFLPEIKDYAKKNNVDPYLVMSLIKQESSYRPKAVSPSNAHGLMQLMPVTARETAKRVKIKRLRIPEDLFNPETNIRLGTSYLRQMIRAFNGHVPLALAAYNAGIGRIRLWTRARPELSSLAKENNSEFLNEIWIDELPWSETSFYVKAILRNFLVYQMLDNGDELALSRPIWKQGLKSGNQ